MTQIATVTALPAPGTAEVTIFRQTACGHSCDGCGQCAGRAPDLVIQAESGVPVALGDRLKGYVRRITEENRIDVSLQQQGFAEVQHSAVALEELIRANGGYLPLNDASSPEEIARMTRMSKKVFKRSLGMLMKSGKVETTENGVKLKQA